MAPGDYAGGGGGFGLLGSGPSGSGGLLQIMEILVVMDMGHQELHQLMVMVDYLVVAAEVLIILLMRQEMELLVLLRLFGEMVNHSPNI